MTKQEALVLCKISCNTRKTSVAFLFLFDIAEFVFRLAPLIILQHPPAGALFHIPVPVPGPSRARF